MAKLAENRAARGRAFSADPPPHLTADGAPRHPGRIEQAEWRDPEDGEALERGPDGRRHQRTVRGYRTIDPLSRLPCQADHRMAASRLRNDWERGSGARAGGPTEKVDGGSSRERDSIAAQLQARRDYEDAVAALGLRASAYVLPIVLSGWTVADLVKARGGNAMAVQGRVMAGLDRLVDWYFPSSAEPFVVPVSPIVAIDVGVVDIPQERLGRARR